jgi:hypothetical protein
MSARSVKLVALGVGIISVGLGVAVACAQVQPPTPKPPVVRAGDPFPVTTVVVFDAKARTATPQIGLLRRGAMVQLQVANLAAGQTLEIDFRVQGAPTGVKGPFARTQKWRGRYTFAADGSITTGPVDSAGQTAWKFDVVVRQKGDTEDVWAVDPMIVVVE